MMEWLLSTRPWSSPSPSVMTHHTLDPILFTSIPLSYYSDSFVQQTSTLDPGCVVSRPAQFTFHQHESDTGIDLAPVCHSPHSPYLFIIFPHSHLVCQHAINIPHSIQMHSPVSLSLSIASHFVPHSYALYPMTHPSIMTHTMLPFCFPTTSTSVTLATIVYSIVVM
jgi:hypothetical protein